MFKKRFFAYVLDILILSFILSFVGLIFPISANVTNLNNELTGISDNFVNGGIDINTYINQFSNISYNIDKELFLSNLIGIVICICYFVVIPLYNNGQSIGKKLSNIKIVSKDDNEVSSNSLILRYLFIDGIGVSILSMCMIFVFKDLYYMIGVSILGFLQFLVVISSVFMVLYRRDKRSLPDLIAGTKVIEVKK